MITDQKTYTLIINLALQKATDGWSEIKKKELLQDSFKEVAAKQYEATVQYPIMSPQHINQ